VDQGSAADQGSCPCGSPAREWAYQYSAIDERVEEETGRKFSLDPSDYVAMCIPCHRRLDHQKDPEQHRGKAESARQRMIAMNQDPQYHEQRMERGRENGRKRIAAMREAGTLSEWTSKGGKARHGL